MSLGWAKGIWMEYQYLGNTQYMFEWLNQKRKHWIFELSQGMETEYSGAKVRKVRQAVIMEKHVLGSDEHRYKSQLYHFLSDLEYDI